MLRLIGGEQALPAYPLMLMLGSASAVGFASFALEPFLMSADRHGAALRARAAAALLYVPAALIGMHAVGLRGAGMASIASALVVFAAQIGPVMSALRQKSNSAAPTSP